MDPNTAHLDANPARPDSLAAAHTKILRECRATYAGYKEQHAGTPLAPIYAAYVAALDAGLAALEGEETPTLPTLRGFRGLHPETLGLVRRFAYALACKLSAAETKYGYSDDWLKSDWMDECRAKLVEHVAKGDPRDVAAYCAFLWHHEESTAPANFPETPDGSFRASLTDANDMCRSAFQVFDRVVRWYGVVYAGTNFGALRDRLRESLERQHRVMYPKSHDGTGPNCLSCAGVVKASTEAPSESVANDGARILTCVYCGQEYPPGTAAWGESVLTEHISTCAKHPMRGVIADNARLRAALAGIIGESEPEALRKLAAVIAGVPGTDADKTVSINAIHALLGAP